MDEAELLQIVRTHAPQFELGDATALRLCGSLQEAREAPYFFEALISFATDLAAPGRAADPSGWWSTIDQEMRRGRHLYYLGNPEAEWFQRRPSAPGDNR